MLRCPACAQSIDASDLRCRACGVVMSEDNRCERCHGVTPAVERDGILVCGACELQRTPFPHLVVVDRRELESVLRVPLLVPAAWGAFACLVGAVAALVVKLYVAAVLCVALALVATYWARRARKLRRRRRDYELELRVIGLAHQRHGILRRRDVAEVLPLTPTQAEGVLLNLARAGRATLEVVDREAAYVFRDAKPTRGLRVKGRDPTGSHRNPSS